MQLGFGGVGTHYPTRLEDMKDIVKIYCRPDMPADPPQQRLPQRLHKPDTSELSITLIYENHCLPHALRQ